jgi:hypothetical protein
MLSGRNWLMRFVLVLTTFLTLAALPASAQIQYFGYVGGADDDQALGETRGFTNFAYLSAGDNLSDFFIRNRVSAMAPLGIKAVIDLGKVLWCDYDGTGRYLSLCSDWAQRWSQWKTSNASILTPDKILAFSIRDEPFNFNTNMNDFEQAAARVKSDLPSIKLLMVEAACVVATDDCGFFPGAGAVARYGGTLPNIDWIGLDAYGIFPKTNTTFQQAVNIFRSKFPGKKWIYVMDGYWDPGLQGVAIGPDTSMDQIADDWYDVASADPNTILLGVFSWRQGQGVEGSQDLPCSVASEHIRIGRLITGRVHNPLLTGLFEGISYVGPSGWACNLDGTPSCKKPLLEMYVNGALRATSSTMFMYTNSAVLQTECGPGGIAYRFQSALTLGDSGYPVTFRARDLDSGSSVTLPSNCPENPACVWYATNYAPKGYMDGISPAGVVNGWVCDPDAPQVSSKVRVALDDGTQVGTFTANLGNEQAVTDQCHGGTLHRFSVQLPPVTTACRQVFAYARDLANPLVEKQIPTLCSGGVSCLWCGH